MEIQRPHRATRTYVQHLIAPPQQVFPLLCPVREAEWIEGWDPLLVLSHSGAAELDCVFITAAQSGEAIWHVSRFEPEAGLVEMFKITPGVTVCRLSIQLAPSSSGTDATVSYSHTSLGPEGDELVAGFTEEYYGHFMRDWEARMNHFLSTGTRRPDRRE
ncbi:MAG TPA: hypothetical protein VF017_17885 [Thermoanaerobaculia bacterium]|nr:hypothetical protein [Thermoanaerobaculia bacterium]